MLSSSDPLGSFVLAQVSFSCLEHYFQSRDNTQIPWYTFHFWGRDRGNENKRIPKEWQKGAVAVSLSDGLYG